MSMALTNLLLDIKQRVLSEQSTTKYLSIFLPTDLTKSSQHRFSA